MCDGVLSPTSPARYFFFLNHLILKHPKNKNQLNPSYVHKEQNVKKCHTQETHIQGAH